MPNTIQSTWVKETEVISKRIAAAHKFTLDQLKAVEENQAFFQRVREMGQENEEYFSMPNRNISQIVTGVEESKSSLDDYIASNFEPYKPIQVIRDDGSDLIEDLTSLLKYLRLRYENFQELLGLYNNQNIPFHPTEQDEINFQNKLKLMDRELNGIANVTDDFKHLNMNFSGHIPFMTRYDNNADGVIPYARNREMVNSELRDNQLAVRRNEYKLIAAITLGVIAVAIAGPPIGAIMLAGIVDAVSILGFIIMMGFIELGITVAAKKLFNVIWPTDKVRNHNYSQEKMFQPPKHDFKSSLGNVFQKLGLHNWDHSLVVHSALQSQAKPDTVPTDTHSNTNTPPQSPRFRM